MGKEKGNPGGVVPLGLPDRPPSVTLMTPGMCYLPLGASVESEKFRQTAGGHRSPRKSKHIKLWNQMVQRQQRRT